MMKKELENFIKNSYLPKSYKSEEKLKSKIAGLTKIGISYKLNEKSEDAFLVMGKIFPNYEFFVKYYKKAQKYNIENKLFSKLDLESITYEVILKNLIKVVKDEEKKIKEDNLKVTKENKSKYRINRRNKLLYNTRPRNYGKYSYRPRRRSRQNYRHAKHIAS